MTSLCSIVLLYQIAGIPQVDIMDGGITTEKDCRDLSHLISDVASGAPYPIEVRMIWSAGSKT